MKRFIAIASASALLVVGTAFVVQAQTSGGILPCADITGGTGTYAPPEAATLTTPATPAVVTWDITLAGPSCPDVQYAVTVYRNGELGTVGTLPSAPPVITSATTTGDSVSQVLRFAIELGATGGEGCVAASTLGVDSSAATDSKNGAAFDADGSGSAVTDRDPDGPAGGDKTNPPETETEYCVPVTELASPSRTAG